MHEVLVWLEGSALGHAMRNSGVWTYGLVNLTHILGIASFFGAILLLDLRLLGLWRHVPIAAIAGPAVPVAASGLAVSFASGLCLITTNATEYSGNPFLLVKFPAIAVGLLNAAVVQRLPGWRAREARALTMQESNQLRVAAGVSLVAWLTAIAAGRLTAYW